MRGDALPRPVNYSLLRVIPPVGIEVDNRKRPVFVIDPRAGQGPGIGGSKQASEIGEAFKAGHPVYFAGFTAMPMEGQRIEDVARAFTVFIEKVSELDPDALGKPFVFGNCQAGWHAIIAACLRPDVVGPVVISAAPLSYWGGVHDKNPMRYLGGILGGTWLDGNGNMLGPELFRCPVGQRRVRTHAVVIDARSARAWANEPNSVSFKHSSRSRPMKLSTKAFC